MRKKWFMVMFILLLLLLASCGTEIQKALDPEVPDAAEVREAYAQALEAYGWFDLTTMPLGSETLEADGMLYQKVEHPAIHTCADLEAYLLTLFSDEIVAELLDQASLRYRDLDGVLYALAADRGTDIFKGEETRSLRRENNQKWKFIVEVELLDEGEEVIGYEIHEFPYELVDGRWVFTDFDLVR